MSGAVGVNDDGGKGPPVASDVGAGSGESGLVLGAAGTTTPIASRSMLVTNGRSRALTPRLASVGERRGCARTGT